MALPIENEALQEIGAAQERAVGRRASADHHMIAAAGAGMAAIDHEFVGAEPRLARFLVKRLRGGDRFAPVRGRMDIDLDHARIGRDFQHIDARIGRRRITFDMHRHLQFGRGRLDRAEQLDIIFKPLDRRHEDGHASVPCFDRQSGADMHVITTLVAGLCRATSCVRS